jgi:hypothetical protein
VPLNDEAGDSAVPAPRRCAAPAALAGYFFATNRNAAEFMQ